MEHKVYIHNGDFVTSSGSEIPDTILPNLGTTYEDYLNGKYVVLTEEQLQFCYSNDVDTPYEVYHMTVNPEATDYNRESLIDRINEYDTSDEVNVFYIDNNPIWFDKSSRVSLSNKVAIEESKGKSTTTLWFNNTPYTMSIEQARQILSDVELYAIECFNNTQNNISEVKTITLKSEINSFDITKGYPEKLYFNIK